MSNRRWSTKQLKETDTLLLIQCLLSERQSNLKLSSPMYNKIKEAKKLIDTLTGIESTIKCNHCCSYIDKFHVTNKQENGSCVPYCPCCKNSLK